MIHIMLNLAFIKKKLISAFKKFNTNKMLLNKLNFDDILFICEFEFQQSYARNLVTKMS